MSLVEQTKMKQEYDSSTNMVIDESGSYEDTFMTSDLLISDYSSMMVEYFVTGKPIIYTHRKNEFNEYALSLSKGFYWVHSIEELNETISMLLSGKDFLREKRQELMKTLFYIPEYGASVIIKDHLKLDYSTAIFHS
jgi:CDP-glycerol glycerophosphotransferase (TagB/SpsB family)